MKLKPFTTILSALLFTSTSLLCASAADKGDLDDSSMFAYQTPADGKQRVIMPAAGPRVQEGADAFLTADFLYFEARQQGLQFAQTGIEASTSGNPSLPEGKVFTQDYHYDPGVRVGLGLGLGHDAWDLFVQYTWFQQNPSKIVHTHTDNSLNTLQATSNMGFSTGSPLTYASSSWKYRLNMADLELGRDSYFSKYLALRYFFGVRAAWQNQHFNTHYKWLDTSNANAETNTKIDQAMKIFAVGLRAGLNGSWFFTPNWSIFGNVSASTLAARAKTTPKDTQFTTADSSTVTTNEYLEQKVSFIEPVLEMMIGFGWDLWFEDDGYHFGLKAGWEESIWISNNKFVTIGSQNHGDLAMQGFVLKARFDF
ncbi:MAG: Lpg1974 family pore-forming outer membrane protein [Rhabdochlamydiaceae bacterium]|nr:Lpg1974 family pore-forming outer membrane protein [Candidatus Amphrikana amoebophyrae]